MSDRLLKNQLRSLKRDVEQGAPRKGEGVVRRTRDRKRRRQKAPFQKKITPKMLRDADKAKQEEKKKFNLKVLETERAASEAFRDIIEKVSSLRKTGDIPKV